MYIVRELSYFISTGAKSMMYTLRVHCLCERVINGVPYQYTSSYYCFNLSTDKETAIERAARYVADCGGGLPFSPDVDFDLEDIKRANAEENERRLAEQEAYERSRTEAIAREVAKYETTNTILIGRYAGKTPAEVFELLDIGWLTYASKLFADDVVDGSKSLGDARSAPALITCRLVRAFLATVDITSNYIGVVGDMFDGEVTLSRVNAYQTNYGWNWMYICFYNGFNVIKFSSTAKGFKDLEIGQKFKMVGTISDHSTYNGQKNTSINKPKIKKA